MIRFGSWRRAIGVCALLLGLRAGVAWAEETVVANEATCDKKEGTNDCRDNFEASAYLGFVVDTFAAQRLKEYLNPEASGEAEQEEIVGFDFQFRLLGKPLESSTASADASGAEGSQETSKKKKWFKGDQLWVYGWTMHGMQSADVDCQASPDIPVCKPFEEQIQDPTEPFLFVLREATSLEAAAGLRWEFAQLQRGAKGSTARAYFNVQAGFLTVEGDDDDVLDNHHVGLGVTSTKGPFRGSFLEVGYGRSDMFLLQPRDRWKVDGLVAWAPKWLDDRGASFFAELTVNADMGSGSDSIRSFFGVDFDLRDFNLFPNKAAKKAAAAAAASGGGSEEGSPSPQDEAAAAG